MNKEKIEKAKCHLEWLLDNAILASEDEPHIENILKYIQHLEQKSETLDKATEAVNKVDDDMADFEAISLKHEILDILKGDKEVYK